MQDIKIKHTHTTGADKSYEGFSKLLLEMANEKVYDRRAAKSRGESNMDVDARAAEKSARQAELEAADKNDYGEDGEQHPDYWPSSASTRPRSRRS